MPNAEYKGVDRRVPPDDAVVREKLDVVVSDLRDLKVSVNDLTASVAKLAVIEERIHGHQQSVMHMRDDFKKDIEGLRADYAASLHRINVLEQNASANQTQTDASSKWLEHGATAVLSAIVGYIIASSMIVDAVPLP